MQEVEDAAVRFGINPTTARKIAQYELLKWESWELTSILDKVKGLKANLLAFDESNVTSATFPDETQESYWIKAPPDMVARSAEQKLALCVNATGAFDLRKENYAALSHVWVEGTHADTLNRGLPRHLLVQIFQKIEAARMEWIWLDSLAVPGEHRKLSIKEEKIKIDLINNMASIYQNAEMVIVIDALLMRLDHDDLADVAVGLICGKWMTRIWTYQEIKLVERALIITGRGLVDYRDVVSRVRDLAGVSRDVSTQIDSPISSAFHNMKYRNLYHTLKILLCDLPEKPSLINIVQACSNRVTGNDIDYARAFFPVLQLEWREGLTREQGMEKIFRSQLYYAKQLLLMNGSPRSAVWPGWAPSYLHGLSGKPDEEVEWESQGLRRMWYAYAVRSRRETPAGFNDKLNVIFELDEGAEGEYVCICEMGNDESEESKAEFFRAISDSIAYILTDSPLEYVRHVGKTCLLVERSNLNVPNEAYVCLIGTVYSGKSPTVPKQTSWLLSHQSPLCTDAGLGKPVEEVSILLHHNLPHDGESLLHVAAREGDVTRVVLLLEKERNMIGALDALGWTPLHTAAFQGHDQIVRLLTLSGAKIDAKDNLSRTPLMFAAEEGLNATVLALLEAGADVNFSDGTFSPLSEAIVTGGSSGRLETVKLLLEHGASPIDPDGVGFYPLHLATKNAELVSILLERGADPNQGYTSGITAMFFAAKKGIAASLERLIEAGASVEAPVGSNTPLYCAIEEQNEEAVAVLLKHHANVNVPCRHSWTPLMLAAKLGHYGIAERLLAAGASITDSCEPKGWTPMHFAASHGHRRLVKLLLSMEGAFLAATLADIEGNTPMALALIGHHMDVVELLRSFAEHSMK